MSQRNYTRLVEWLALALVFYAAALEVTQPQIQTLCWKLGHITSGAFVGYWIDRAALGRVTDVDTDLRKVARAIVVLASIYGIAGGL